MSAVPSDVRNLPKPALGVARLSGRIVGRRAISTQSGKLYLTLVKLPAPDEFSSPQTVELRSRQQLGELQGDWTGEVRIGGYPRSYMRDDEEGGKTRVNTAENRLEVVEG